MKNIKCLTRILVPIALLCGTSIASAADSGFYVGVNIGEAKYELDEEASAGFLSTASSSEVDQATAWNLAVGYRFNRYFGVEASYMDLGSYKYAEAGTVSAAPLQTGTYDLEASASGLAVALTVAIPVGGFDIHAKLGAINADTEVAVAFRSQTSTPYPALITNTESATTIEPMYGIGIGYTIAEQYNVAIDWTSIPKIGDEEDTGESDVNVVTLGVSYRF